MPLPWPLTPNPHRPHQVEISLSECELHVHPRGVDKGGLLRQLLTTQGVSGARPDLVLLLGDDASDEPAFAALEVTRTRTLTLTLTLILTLTLTLTLTRGVARRAAAVRALAPPRGVRRHGRAEALARVVVPRRAGG